MRPTLRSVVLFTCAAIVPLFGCMKDEPKEVPVSSVGSALSGGRAFAGDYFELKLDGLDCGLVQLFEGGDVETTVVDLPAAHDYYGQKHLGNVKYSDVKLQLGATMGRPIRDWIDAALSMNYERKSGELSAAHFKVAVRQIREFHDALLTEIGLPAADAGAKSAAYVSVGFSVGTVMERAEPFTPVDAGAPTAVPGLSASRVRVTLAGTELPNVTGLGAIKIKLDSSAGVPKPTVSDLVVRLPESGTSDLQHWLEESRIAGQPSPRNAVVDYFAEDNATVAVRLLLSGVVISGLAQGVATMHVGSARLAATPSQNDGLIEFRQ